MLWANGAILLKRLVHLSNIEHLVVLAEKKSLWTVSVRGPNPGDFNILFLGSLFLECVNHPNVARIRFLQHSNSVCDGCVRHFS